jgi:hypothetical protein
MHNPKMDQQLRPVATKNGTCSGGSEPESEYCVWGRPCRKNHIPKIICVVKIETTCVVTRHACSNEAGWFHPALPVNAGAKQKTCSLPKA